MSKGSPGNSGVPGGLRNVSECLRGYLGVSRAFKSVSGDFKRFHGVSEVDHNIET